MVDEFVFDVPSSDGISIYSVAIRIVDNEEPIVRCNCKAGVLGKLCKHKIAVVSANISDAGAQVPQSNWVHPGVKMRYPGFHGQI
jgi:hypothetical protein